MPKDVDLSAAGKKTITYDDIKAKVAKATMPVPPGGRKIPGVTGTLPLPTNRPVSVIQASTLSEEERKDLKKVGWKEGEDVPSNMADILAKVQADTAREIATADLSVDPRIKDLEVTTVQEKDLTPTQQAEIRKKMAETLAAFSPTNPVIPPSVESGIRKLEREANAAPTRRREEPMIVDDTVRVPMPPPTAPTPPTPPAAVTEPSPAKPLDLGADKAMSHCPHCEWPLNQADIPMPTYGEKMAFLHSILGLKCFVKEYELFGGAVTVVFRNLTTQELDVAFKHAYQERFRGLLPTELDFWERVNRLRLYLQIQQFRSKQFSEDLPDGLSKESNPNAEAHWKLPDPVDPSDTGLQHIEQYVLEKVLRSESLNRVVANQAQRFNRLVSKLEGLVDNSDFWNATEEQS